MMPVMRLTRNLLSATPLLAVVALAAGCGGSAGTNQAQAPTQSQTSPPSTAATAGSCDATVQQTQGPYWKADSPGQANLRSGNPSGTPLDLTGKVLDSDCQPVKGAIVDFWQADGNGQYDNSGYRLRGHQTTGENGQWTLKTVVPGQYPGRTEHIHLKIWNPDGKVALISQLYLPGSKNNDSDGIYQPSTEIQDFGKSGSGYTGSFDFVLPG